MNYIISPGHEFADGRRIQDEGDTSQILRNSGSVPEFDAIREFFSRGNDAIYE